MQTDTRKLKAGDIFFALKGPNFNGNKFAAKALKMGAAYAIADEQLEQYHDRIIIVKDVLTSLQELAKYHRQQLNIPFLAITGSNGKTTTKELIKAVLSQKFNTYATEGNLNNHIGIPLTLLKINKDIEFAVIEMGANHLGEIKRYCQIAMPDFGLITNCGKAHLEGFGSEEGVRKGKGELFDYLKENRGAAFLNKELYYLPEMAKGIEQIIAYDKNNLNITEPASQQTDQLSFYYDGQQIETHLTGVYNLPNIMAAIAVGEYFNVEKENIREAIKAYLPDNNRSQIIKQGNNTIIMDAYNANPSSMKVAIENFAQIKATKKVVLLGAMMELGSESRQEHQALINLLKKYPWQKVILVGGDFAYVHHPYLFFPDVKAAAAWYHQQQFDNTAILIKGSRSMTMEKILD